MHWQCDCRHSANAGSDAVAQISDLLPCMDTKQPANALHGAETHTMNLDRSDLPAALQSGQPGERTPFCPDASTLAACYDGTLPRAEQDRLAQHLAGCAHCRAQLGMLARLAEDGQAAIVPGDILARAKQLPAGAPGMRRRWPAVAAAAVAVLAVGLVLTAGRHPDRGPVAGDPAAPNGDTPSRQLRTLEPSALRPEILSPSEGGELGPGAYEFRRTPVDGAVQYELLLVDDSGNPVLTERLDVTSFQPQGSPALEPGARYFVRVTAYLADGRTAGSRHIAFSIAARRGEQD